MTFLFGEFYDEFYLLYRSFFCLPDFGREKNVA